MMRKIGLVFGVAAALFLGATGSASAGTLDQHQDNSDGAPALFGNTDGPQSLAQTFTAGIGGGLDQVDLMLEKLGTPPVPSITVEIRSTSGGAPGPLSAVLATASVPTASLGNSLAFVSVPITPAVPVSAGAQYAIVAYNAGVTGDAASWGEKISGNPYAQGAGYTNFASFPPDGDWVDPGIGTDQAFKTYVVPSPAATPTPAPTPKKKKKCKKKKKHKRSAESAKKKHCKKRSRS
jgi:hypothetical protein